jgi:prevent-host-death family protein
MVMIMVINQRERIMQTIQASEFKARCLALMDEVSRSGEVLVVTKNGRPVAELHPYMGGRAASPFGLHRDLEIRGDIIEPIEDAGWKALE